MRIERWRSAVVSMLLATILTGAGIGPAATLAQDDAAQFSAALAARAGAASLAGPFTNELIQEEGFNTVNSAGVSVTDFSVSATFVNPSEPDAPNWDVGISFRRSGDSVQQVVVDSNGFWYDTPYPEGTRDSGFIVEFNTEPGAANTLDLVVAGSRALFGVNGVFLAGFDLPPGAAADVQVGTGYFVGSVVAGRAIAYRDFQVWPSPQSGAAQAAATVIPTATPVDSATPAPSASSSDISEPPSAIVAANAARFAELLDAQATVVPLAGPFSANLREVVGSVMLAWANLNLSEFHATATSTVPADTSGTPWDIGFMFGASGSGTLRYVVDSLGQVYFSAGANTPSVVGQALSLRTASGESNSLDLFVAGGQAWLGVNGELAAIVDLPADATSADIGFGSGFYSDQTVADRLIQFSDFVVLPLAPDALGPVAVSGTLTPEQIAAFRNWVSETERVPPLVGPFSGRLVEATAGTPPVAPAGVSVIDFGVTATFANPENPTGGLWDIGARFHGDGTAFARIVVDSLGDIYFTQRGEGSQKIGSAPAFDPSPGASNTLHLFVEGDQALLGVNGEPAAAITLTAAPIASDVQIGTAFFNEDFVAGRVTDYRDFRIWEIS